MIVKGTPMNDCGYELRTRTDGKGDGVFATRTFEINETAMVGVIDGTLDGNDSHATQVGRNSWVRHGGLGPKVNHSCSPDCGVRLNEAGACDFVARRQINTGDEITFDYAMRNYAIEHFPGDCLCGTSTCRGSVTGWKDLSDAQKSAYDGEVMPYWVELDRETVK
jgi:hypothetical protein